MPKKKAIVYVIIVCPEAEVGIGPQQIYKTRGQEREISN
jgi:hypothetical protein